MREMNLSWRSIVLSLLLLTVRCFHAITAQKINLTQDWELGPLYKRNEAYCIIQNRFFFAPGVTGYVIIKDGLIEAEGYRCAEGKECKTQVYSVTKSLSTMLIGILVDKGLLAVNSTLGEIFDADEDWLGVNQTEEMKQITMFEILTMSSGLVEVQEQEDYSLNTTLSVLYYDEDMVGNFQYLATSHILSRIIYRVSGMTPKELVIDSGIFAAMGISEDDYLWDTFDDIEGSAYGLQTSPRTLAKLGMLYLQDGYAAEGVSVISPAWVAESIKNQLGENGTYGYQWYPNMYGRDGSFGAIGALGNYLVCIPDQNLVIAITSDLNVFEADFFADMVQKYIDRIDNESNICFGNFLIGSIIDWIVWGVPNILPLLTSFESIRFFGILILIIYLVRVSGYFGCALSFYQLLDFFFS